MQCNLPFGAKILLLGLVKSSSKVDERVKVVVMTVHLSAQRVAPSGT